MNQLRFMKIAEHDHEQLKLKIVQQENDANIQWCVAGNEDEVREASKTKSL